MMKKTLLLGIMALAAFLPKNAFADEAKVINRGDSLAIAADEGYTSYQWQFSSDGKYYYNLPSKTEKNLAVLPYTAGYYRAAAVLDSKTTYINTTQLSFAEKTYNANQSPVSAAQGYVEVDGKPGSGISIGGDGRDDMTLLLTKKLTNWTNAKAHAAYYIHHAGTYFMDSKMTLTCGTGTSIVMRLKVYNLNGTDTETPMIDTYLSFKGTGSPMTIDLFSYKKMPKTGWYKYDFECVRGNGLITNIDRFTFNTNTATSSYPGSFLSSPSVHLGDWGTTKVGAPTGASYDWCYQEVMIPEDADFSGTYAMSLGVLNGYMGIQINGPERKDVIFSMWDNGSTDENPNLPNFKKAGAVDANENFTIERFANEGTGCKCFATGNYWKLGTFVQFITNARPEVTEYHTTGHNGEDSTIVSENTLVTAWFNAQDGKGWQYLATTRRPGAGSNFFNGWYSFLENYSWTSGQMKRKAFYRNGFMHTIKTDEWIHRNKVRFGHTDGGSLVGSRTDYEQGVSEDDPYTFYLTTGGYTPHVERAAQVPLLETSSAVDTIDIAALNARVDQAIATEARLQQEAEERAAAVYDKTGWKVIEFSSQETSGEGSVNGRAQTVVDGDETTYWHSAWQSGSASFPHSMTIDMLEEKPINAFDFVLSGGSTRHQKDIEIWTAGDDKNFTLQLSTECTDAEKFAIELPETVTARYVKLVIKTSQTGDVNCRINEISVLNLKTVGIESSTSETSENLAVYSKNNGEICVVSPESCDNIKLSVYTINGALIQSQNFYSTTENGVYSFALNGQKKGIFVVKAEYNGKTMSSSVIVK